MPEYQEILDTEVQPEAPLTSSLGVRFRDNPIALASGATGAPRIQTAALNNSAVTTVKINNSAVTAQKINIQQRSFSGSLDANSATTIAISDANPLYPRVTSGLLRHGGESNGGTGSRLRISSGGGAISYSLEWRYIA